VSAQSCKQLSTNAVRTAAARPSIRLPGHPPVILIPGDNRPLRTFHSCTCSSLAVLKQPAQPEHRQLHI
jgi:hypothetical protein